MKKIAIIGTHGVGKTTLCQSLAEYTKAQGKRVECVGEVVRDCPYPINQAMNYRACEWIVFEQIMRERTAETNNQDVVICDRSAFDPLCYFQITYNENDNSPVDVSLWYHLREYATDYLRTYDHIILVKSTTKSITGDGFRSTGVKFHKAVDDEFFSCFGNNSPRARKAEMIIESHQVFHKPETIIQEIYEECLS